MSAVTEAPPERPARREWVGAGLTALLLAYGILLHHGLGPAPSSAPQWWEPRDFLHGVLADLGVMGRPGLAMWVPALPAAALALGAFLTTRSAIARWLALSGVIAAACFGFYGVGFPLPWRIFGWRWSGTLVAFSALVGAALASVWLARRWQRLGAAGRVASYLPVFALVVGIERNVTGTDPALPFALSPWPAVQVFGLDTLATGIAFALLGAAAGLTVFRRLSPRAGAVAGALVAGVVTLAVPSLALGVGTDQGLLAFRAGTRTVALVAVLTLLLGAGAALRAARRPDALAARARGFGLAALLVGLPLLTGQLLARLDYDTTRNDRAARVIQALDAYYAREGLYPDALEELVGAGDLDRVPRPRIGFAGLGAERFTYDSFGTSYLIEFSAPRWVQCAYNPPYPDEEEEGAPGEGEEALGGAWSCPSKPPELW